MMRPFISSFGSGTADRPVRDSLAVFNAERGGLRYYTAPTVATGTYTDGERTITDLDPAA
jgi:hypothetical protein